MGLRERVELDVESSFSVCYYRDQGNTANDFQIVNTKGEMKGSAITGPVGKEAAELWPVSPP